LQRAQFDRRSEKLDPEQLLLAFEDIEQAIAGDEAREDEKNPVAARARADAAPIAARFPPICRACM
jgi:transposase